MYYSLHSSPPALVAGSPSAHGFSSTSHWLSHSCCVRKLFCNEKTISYSFLASFQYLIAKQASVDEWLALTLREVEVPALELRIACALGHLLRARVCSSWTAHCCRGICPAKLFDRALMICLLIKTTKSR